MTARRRQSSQRLMQLKKYWNNRNRYGDSRFLISFVFRNRNATNCVSISEAVAKREALASAEDFLVVAYQDGGLISISGTLLPFQEIAQPAEWWRPKY
jgi:hypothetical protein